MKKTLGTMVAIMVVCILIGTFNTEKYATAGETGRDGRFIAYDNGTVLDTSTNLMWATKDNGRNIRWPIAQSYCEKYRGGGYTDWRMPKQDELAGLYDVNKSQEVECGSALNHLATDLIRLTCWWTWASETDGNNAARFTFTGGGRFWNGKAMGNMTRVLPVRSAK